MHGCRTSFRNWGADNKEHNFRREVLEFCLSHRVGDEAELSYWDSEMIKRRRVVMEEWSNYVKPNVKLKSTRTSRSAPAPDGRLPPRTRGTPSIKTVFTR